jgi:outer membrane protein
MGFLWKVITLGVFTVAFMFNTQSSFAKITVGLVDFQKVLLSVDEGKSVRTKLEDFYKQKQNVLKKEEDKFKDLQQKFEKQKTVLNESARQGKEKELRDLYMTIQEQTMNYQKELQEMENTLKKPIIEKIKAISEQVSKTSNVDMSFESGSTPIIYAQEQKELTEEVVQAYNKKYPSKN